MIHVKTRAELKKELLSCFNKYAKIGLVTHKNPDGDGLAACLAVQEFLKGNGKKADVVLEEEAPANLKLISAKERSLTYQEDFRYDLIVVLDCQSNERIGKCAALTKRAEKVIAIDHHEDTASIEFDLLYNDPHAVSTGYILYQALKEEIQKLTADSIKYIATALYITVLNDTNNFINNNTDAAVFKFCGELASLGIRPNLITIEFLLTRPPTFYRFIGDVLATIKLHHQEKILFFHSTLKMLADNGLDQEATTKLTNWVKGAEGVEVVVYFREEAENLYRLSLRSVSLNVNAIAKQFGGGGHKYASGCEISGSLAEVEQLMLELIGTELG